MNGFFYQKKYCFVLEILRFFYLDILMNPEIPKPVTAH